MLLPAKAEGSGHRHCAVPGMEGAVPAMMEMWGAGFAGSSPPFLGRKRAAVDVDVGPERRSPRYHETCLALAGVEESSAAVLEPRSLRW